MIPKWVWAGMMPAILAIGALYWLFFIDDLRVFENTVAQENRHAEIVGAKPLPKAAVRIVVRNKRDVCTIIDRAEVNGGELWVYYHNGCTAITTYTTVHWTGISPDGTVILSGWAYTRADLESGQRAEFHTNEIKDDPRMEALEVKARYNDEP